MNENLKRQESSGQPQHEQDVLMLLKKIQQQLVFLERKVDALGGGSSPRPFNKDRHFRRPPRSFDHPPRNGEEKREHGSGQTNISRPHYYNRNRGEERQGFSQNKKPFFRDRKHKHKQQPQNRP